MAYAKFILKGLTSLSTYVKLKDGSLAPVEFSGAVPSLNIKALFVTNNKELIDGLKNHSDYGNYFELSFEEADKAEPKAAPVVVKETHVITEVNETNPAVDVNPATEDNGSDSADSDSKLLVSQLDTLNGAKKYLNETFGVPYSKLKNTKDIILMGKDNKVSFPNLEAKISK